MLMVLAVSLFLQIGPPMPQPVPPPTEFTVRNEIVVQAPPPDPQVVAEMAGDSFAGIIVVQVAPFLANLATDALNLPDFVRRTPLEWSVEHPAVRSLADIVRNGSYALIGFAVAAWALTTLLQGWASPIGRLALGIALSIGNLQWWTWGIRLNNAISDMIGAPSLRDLVGNHLKAPELTANPSEVFGPAVISIAVAIVTLMLVVSMFMRLALIAALIIGGSIAWMCKSSEQSDRFYSLYVGLAAGTLFSQIGVVICLELAEAFGSIGTGVVATLLGLAVLMLARRLPGMFGSRMSQAGGSGIGRLGLFVLLRRAVARV